MSDERHGRCPGGAECGRSVGLVLGLMLGVLVVDACGSLGKAR